LRRKKGIDNFRKSVKESVNEVTIKNVRRFGARIRRYMLAYCHFDSDYNDEEGNHQQENKVTYEVIENFVKKESKSHRSVMDCETGYLTKVWRESQHLPDEILLPHNQEILNNID
jgi:hypothetical protein